MNIDTARRAAELISEIDFWKDVIAISDSGTTSEKIAEDIFQEFVNCGRCDDFVSWLSANAGVAVSDAEKELRKLK